MSEDKHDPMLQTYLVTYHRDRKGSNITTHYDLTQDVEEWIEQKQINHTDTNQNYQCHILNVLKVSEAFYQKWEGKLVGL